MSLTHEEALALVKLRQLSFNALLIQIRRFNPDFGRLGHAHVECCYCEEYLSSFRMRGVHDVPCLENHLAALIVKHELVWWTDDVGL